MHLLKWYGGGRRPGVGATRTRRRDPPPPTAADALKLKVESTCRKEPPEVEEDEASDGGGGPWLWIWESWVNRAWRDASFAAMSVFEVSAGRRYQEEGILQRGILITSLIDQIPYRFDELDAGRRKQRWGRQRHRSQCSRRNKQSPTRPRRGWDVLTETLKKTARGTDFRERIGRRGASCARRRRVSGSAKSLVQERQTNLFLMSILSCWKSRWIE